MPPRARLVRDAAALLLVIGLCAGTLVWQTDDTWPFAQMRMFPGGGESAVSIVVIEADLADGLQREMNPFAFHLKRAEIEGQMDRIQRNPWMLRDLVARYNGHVPAHRKIVRLRLVRREAMRARPGSEYRWMEHELARWPA